MTKVSFFTGQPIFNQLLSLVPSFLVRDAAVTHHGDHYCKRFKTMDHLITMLYAIYNRCTSLREVTTGILAWEQRIHHIRLKHYPRRSTISDANTRRPAVVFESIYYGLVERYQHVLPDSRSAKQASRLYLFDSTTISLFHQILETSGRPSLSGKVKGGIKVHTLVRSDQDVPCLIRYSAATANDSQFLRQVQLPKGSIIVFDRGYKDYQTFNRFTAEGIHWITRLRERTVVTVVKQQVVEAAHKKAGVLKDEWVILGNHHHPDTTKVRARIVTFKDPLSGKEFQFVTNNLRFSPLTIAQCYRKRWQIELLFKRIKQNYPLHYFLGDSANAIQIQIWCVLIADLLLKVMKSQFKCRWAFSTLCALVRLHLMTYIQLSEFIKSAEKALLKKIQGNNNYHSPPSLFAL
jgi:hypothetical protein